MAAHNHRQRKKNREEQAQKGRGSQYYGIGAVLAVGVIGGFGYYIYQTKKGPATADQGHKHQWGEASREVPLQSRAQGPPQQSSHNQLSNPPPKTNKYEMDEISSVLQKWTRRVW